jgi:catechol 2,3-dioxygenase-like lactoylglutathione lyase family enzyme
MAMAVVGFDHLVLIVADVERSLAWYRDVIGLAPERVEEWRAGKAPFPSVRIDATTVIDIIGGERHASNMDHLCLVLGEGEDAAAFAAARGLPVHDGPDRRWGAQGWATSVYTRDPDGNVVELRCY